ncbi:MAG: GntR family transcriptional regulator [Kordiimonas sp.]
MRKRPLTIAQSVAHELREQILSREIKGGEPLTQESIAAKFGTSIIPVREAIRQLASEGLVEVSTHRGATVTELTLAKIQEWIQLRRLIEVDLVDGAIANMTDEHIATAEAILSDYNKVLTDRIDVERWSQFNWDFHGAIYAPANRPETMQILSSLHYKSDRYVRLQLLSGDHIDRAQQEHIEMLECCKRRDAEGLKALLETHISEVENDIVEALSDE